MIKLRKLIHLVLFTLIGYNLYSLFTLGESRHIMMLPPAGKMPLSIDVKHNPIIRLATTTNIGFCSGWVIDTQLAITAAHCINHNKHITKAPIKIFDDKGKDTGHLAQAASYDEDLDLGLIVGDFHEFSSLQTNFYHEGFPRSVKHQYIMCGFPLGQKLVTCTEFSPTRMNFFRVEGKGHLIPGYSGGPVIDITTNQAVGVNSAVSEDEIIIAPIQGILGLFRLE